MWTVALALLAAQPGEVVQPLTTESEEKYSTYWENDYWNVWASQKYTYCAAMSFTVAGDVFSILYDAKEKTVSLYFSDQHSTSLKDGDTRNLRILFLTGNRDIDDGWDEREFTISRDDDDAKVRFLSGALDPEMLYDLARHEKIGFFYNDKAVKIFTLKGSAEVIKHLRACALEHAGIDPRDVFAQ